MMKKEKRLFKIYVLGNPLLREDSLPLKLVPQLKEFFNYIDFVEFDPTENFPEEENLVILDSIINIDKIEIIKDIDKIQSNSSYSLHDFDLAFNLKLLKKLNKINDVTIIGVPSFYKYEDALNELKEIIANLLLRND